VSVFAHIAYVGMWGYCSAFQTVEHGANCTCNYGLYSLLCYGLLRTQHVISWFKAVCGYGGTGLLPMEKSALKWIVERVRGGVKWRYDMDVMNCPLNAKMLPSYDDFFRLQNYEYDNLDIDLFSK